MNTLVSKADIFEAFDQPSIDALYDGNWELFSELNDVFTKREFFEMSSILNDE